MRLSTQALLIVAFLFVLLALAGSRLAGGLAPPGRRTQTPTLDRTPSATPAATPTAVLPPEEVLAEDLPNLPRYPGSTIVAYRRTLSDALIETRVTYVAPDSMEAVHDYYRRVFRTHEWNVVDLNYSAGEWTFVVMHGEREAILEIRPREAGTEYEIEFSEPRTDDPQAAQQTSSPQATATDVAPPTIEPSASPTATPTKADDAALPASSPTPEPPPPVVPTATTAPPPPATNPPLLPPAPTLPPPPPPPPASTQVPVPPPPPDDDDDGGDDDGEDGGDDDDDGGDD